MSRQIRIDHLGKQWDDFVVACGTLFGPPDPVAVAGVTALPHSVDDILLAGKVMIFCAPRVSSDEDIASIIRQWLWYLPCFIQDEEKVAYLNSHWRSMINGDELATLAREELEAFFKTTRASRERIHDEVKLFLDRASIIPVDDPLGVHKACILLGCEYFTPTPPLRKTLMKALFPSFL